MPTASGLVRSVNVNGLCAGANADNFVMSTSADDAVERDNGVLNRSHGGSHDLASLSDATQVSRNAEVAIIFFLLSQLQDAKLGIHDLT